MKQNRYRITYKNGAVREFKAYAMELIDDKLYQCCKAFVGDQGIPSVINGSNMVSVECIERNNDL